MIRATRCGLWMALVAIAACDSPSPGPLTFDLDTPHAVDGAIEVSVTAPVGLEVLDITAACGACRVFARPVSETEIRAVVTGSIVDGPFIAVTVSDTRASARYRVGVVSAAALDYSLRPDVSGYAVVTVP